MSEREPIYKNKIIDVGLERVVFPDGSETRWAIVRHPGGAVILAANDVGEVCLIKQFRHAAGGWVWELPAGVLEPGEAPEPAAHRELLEEVGVRCKKMTSLGWQWSTPGFTDEKLHLFLAQNLSLHETEQEAEEFIEVHWLPMATALAMCHSGEINDSKTIVSLFRASALLTTPANL